MGKYVASEVIKTMIHKDIKIKGAKILILGITFKENCPDVRNTKVVDVIAALKEYGSNITIYDPWANEEEVYHEYGLISTKIVPTKKFDTIVLTVSHNEFLNLDVNKISKSKSVVYDVKNFFNIEKVDKSL